MMYSVQKIVYNIIYMAAAKKSKKTSKKTKEHQRKRAKAKDAKSSILLNIIGWIIQLIIIIKGGLVRVLGFLPYLSNFRFLFYLIKIKWMTFLQILVIFLVLFLLGGICRMSCTKLTGSLFPYLTYSNLHTFEVNKNEWIDKYLLRKPEKPSTKFMIIGQLVEYCYNKGITLPYDPEYIQFIIDRELIKDPQNSLITVSYKAIPKNPYLNAYIFDYDDTTLVNSYVSQLNKILKEKDLEYQKKVVNDFVNEKFLGFIDYYDQKANTIYELKTTLKKSSNLDLNDKIKQAGRQADLYRELLGDKDTRIVTIILTRDYYYTIEIAKTDVKQYCESQIDLIKLYLAEYVRNYIKREEKSGEIL